MSKCDGSILCFTSFILDTVVGNGFQGGGKDRSRRPLTIIQLFLLGWDQKEGVGFMSCFG